LSDRFAIGEVIVDLDRGLIDRTPHSHVHEVQVQEDALQERACDGRQR